MNPYLRIFQVPFSSSRVPLEYQSTSGVKWGCLGVQTLCAKKQSGLNRREPASSPAPPVHCLGFSQWRISVCIIICLLRASVCVRWCAFVCERVCESVCPIVCLHMPSSRMMTYVRSTYVQLYILLYSDPSPQPPTVICTSVSMSAVYTYLYCSDRFDCQILQEWLLSGSSK